MSTKVNEVTNDSDHANSDEREATELQSYNPPAIRNAASVTTAADDNSYSVRTNRLKRQRPDTFLELIGAFWTRHVVVAVPHEACRDHFGAFFSIIFWRHWLWIRYGTLLGVPRFFRCIAASILSCELLASVCVPLPEVHHCPQWRVPTRRSPAQTRKLYATCFLF